LRDLCRSQQSGETLNLTSDSEELVCEIVGFALNHFALLSNVVVDLRIG
jgi:hypothetical protein